MTPMTSIPTLILELSSSTSSSESSLLACSWLCSFHPQWVRSFHPLWVRSSVIHHGVLDLRRLRLFVDSQSSVLVRASGFFVSSIIQSCSLARGLVVSQHHCLLPPRAARVESVVFSRSCNATLLSRVLLLRSSWHSMSRPPMALHGSPASLHASPCFRQAVCLSTC